LEQRVERLEQENKALLERWLAKINAEAETMNDANEFLEQIRGLRMSSPAAGEDTSVGDKRSSI